MTLGLPWRTILRHEEQFPETHAMYSESRDVSHGSITAASIGTYAMCTVSTMAAFPTSTRAASAVRTTPIAYVMASLCKSLSAINNAARTALLGGEHHPSRFATIPIDTARRGFCRWRRSHRHASAGPVFFSHVR